jgi:hypothetical protein
VRAGLREDHLALAGGGGRPPAGPGGAGRGSRAGRKASCRPSTSRRGPGRCRGSGPGRP